MKGTRRTSRRWRTLADMLLPRRRKPSDGVGQRQRWGKIHWNLAASLNCMVRPLEPIQTPALREWSRAGRRARAGRPTLVTSVLARRFLGKRLGGAGLRGGAVPWFTRPRSRAAVSRGLAARRQETRRGCAEAALLSRETALQRALSLRRSRRKFGATSPRATPHPSSGQMDACRLKNPSPQG